MGSFISGMNLGVYNSAPDNISATLDWGSNKDYFIPTMNAMMHFGATFGALSAGPLATKKGRRQAILILDIITIIASAFFLIPFTPTFAIGRFLSGFIAGGFCVLSPLFIFEFAPVSISGRIGSLIQLNITLGIVFMYALALPLPTGGYKSNDLNYWWMFMFALQSVFALFQLFLMLMKFKYDTPVWLLEQNRREEAERSLRQYYDDQSAASALVRLEKSIQKSKEEAGESSYADLLCCRKGHSKSFRIGIMLNFIQQWCGINAILGYSTSIFSEFGSEFVARVFTVLIGLVNMGATLILFPAVNKYGRKPMLWIGSLGMAACLIFDGIFSGPVDATVGPPLAFILIYIVFFETSAGPLCWIVCGEILAPKAMSICLGMNWASATAVVFLFPIMVNAFSMTYTFFFYAGICLISVPYLWFDLIETKGRDKQDLKTEFSKLR
mmetsp:Transcript_11361/g.11447  ORF Transcript_11361/g.11447 Transcript_11361/m.11447 type:complete len:441 (-) Transcript_11361:31-1353(-)